MSEQSRPTKGGNQKAIGGFIASVVQPMALLGFLLLLLGTKFSSTTAYPLSRPGSIHHAASTKRPRPFHKTLESSSSSSSADYSGKDWNQATARAFDAAVKNRFACKAFLRFDQRHAASVALQGNNTNTTTTTTTASISDPSIVARAVECLEISRLTPSAFNTQVRFYY
jgi:hypothetical protein